MLRKVIFFILNLLYRIITSKAFYEAQHVYALRKQKKDRRDFKVYKSTLRAVNGFADLSKNFPPVYNQGQLGSCTAQGIAAVFDYERKKTARSFLSPSRLFIYYNEREVEGTIDEDAGAEIRNGIKVIAKKGVCSEALWAYDVAKFKKRPPAKCFTEAEGNQALLYRSINDGDIETVKTILDAEYSIVLGIMIYESFESTAVELNGIVPMPSKLKEQLLGGHCVVIVGYDDRLQRFKLRNSWGEGWGDKGYFYLPYAYVKDSSLASDLWVIQKVE